MKVRKQTTITNRVAIIFIMIGMLYVCVIGSTHYVHAQSVEYSYDSLGRVTLARYPDGTTIEYQYDANGNIENMIKKAPSDNEAGGNTSSGSHAGGNGSSDNEAGGNSSSGSHAGGNGSSGNDTGGNTSSGSNDSGVGGNSGTSPSDGEPDTSVQDLTPSAALLHDSAEDIAAYNKFKKRKPVIKSLEVTTEKGKPYLHIKIKQVKKRGIYGEIGYQIKYATNKYFKKVKTVNVTRHKKNSVTGKKWKVKKNKTYYVKVRAYLQKKNGKKVYTKYSKVKKIKVGQ